MNLHEWLDSIPDKEFEKEVGIILNQNAARLGMTAKEYFKKLVPEYPLPLDDDEMFYGKKVIERLWSKR